MTTYIHVNRGVVDANRKRNANEPSVRFQEGKYGTPTYCHELAIDGPSHVVYSAHVPILPCGARMVIATEAPVRIVR